MTYAHIADKSENRTFIRIMPFLLILALAAAGTTMTDCSDAAALNGECGPDMSWELDQQTGTLVISGVGSMYDYGTETDPAAPWSGCSGIRDIIVKTGVRTIGDNAFTDMDVTSAVLPSGLTMMGSYAFSGCSSLSSVNIPDTVMIIDSGAFEGCSSVKEFRIPAVTEVIGEGCFYGCHARYTVDQDNRGYCVFNGMLIDGRESMIIAASPDVGPICTIPDTIRSVGRGAFMDNTDLSIMKNESNRDLKVISDDAFKGCTGLKEFGSGYHNVVYRICSGAFEGCTSLENVSEMQQLRHIGDGAFRGCSALPYLDVPNADSIGSGAFEGCTSLCLNAYGPVYIGEGAFRGCENLRGIDISKLENGVLAPGVFDGCISLCNVKGIENLTELGDRAFRGCASMQFAELDSAEHFGKDVFYGAYGIQGILINHSVTSLPVNTFTPNGPCYVICSPDLTLEQNIGSGFFHYSYQIHTVTFLDTDGSIFIQYRVRFVDDLPFPETHPVMESDSIYDHPFLGWECDDGSGYVTHDLTVTPVFGDVHREYTLEWYDSEGLFRSETAYYDDVIYKPLIDPSAWSTRSTDYTFIGWNGFDEGMRVTADVRFDAMYSDSVRQYLIRFQNADGTTAAEMTLDYGAEIPVPDLTPVKESDSEYDYSFAGWKDLFEDTTVKGDMTFKPSFDRTLRMYTITFLNDGEVWSTHKVTYCGHVKKPSDEPEREPDSQHQYRFKGWEGRSMNEPVRKDRTYNAEYIEEPRQFSVKYIAGDQRAKSFSAGYGDPVPAPPIVEDWSDGCYRYHVTGWDDPMTDRVTDNLIIHAVIQKTAQVYLVEFAADGKMCQYSTLPFGAPITAPASAPFKAGTHDTEYTFAGWKGYTEGMTVTGDMVFEAVFDEKPRFCTIRFVSEGRTVMETEVPNGSAVSCPADPVKEDPQGVGYTFAGWKGYTEGMLALHDMTFEAEYSAGEDVRIVFKTGDRVISDVMYPRGTLIVAPSDPCLPYSSEPYVFDGWNGYTEGMLAVENAVFTAGYHNSGTCYTVEFKAGGVCISSCTLCMGDEIHAPDASDVPAEEGMIFIGWNGYTEGMTVTGDMTFDARYSDGSDMHNVVFRLAGDVLHEQRLPKGERITLPEEPSLCLPGYECTFLGWQGYLKGMTVTGDMTFDALFSTSLVDTEMNREDNTIPIVLLPGCSLCIGDEIRDRICSQLADSDGTAVILGHDMAIGLNTEGFGSISWYGVTMTEESEESDGIVRSSVVLENVYGDITDSIRGVDLVLIKADEDMDDQTVCFSMENGCASERLECGIADLSSEKYLAIQTDRLGTFVIGDDLEQDPPAQLPQDTGSGSAENGEEDDGMVFILIGIIAAALIAVGAAVYLKRR